MSIGCEITLSGVTKRYGPGAAAVEDVTLSLPRARVTALLGPSGSGKSTLLRLIAGLETLEAGAIRFDGETVSSAQIRAPPESRRVGVVFQDYALFPHLSAADNVAFGLSGLERAARGRQARDWLARVGLADRASAFPHMLSGGEQQRVALARALAPRPRAVLLDEPFSGLDPGLRDALRETTLEAIAQSGATAVFITHDAEEALAVADQLAILQAGRLVQAAGPRVVYDTPANLAAAAALGPVNVMEAKVEAGRLETPFGAIPARGLADGARAQAVVRVEAVTTAPGEVATVVARRPQGASDRLWLRVGDATWRGASPARTGPAVGERTGVRLDPAGAFAFPLSPA